MGVNIMQAFKQKPAPLNFVLPGIIAGTVGAIVSPGGAGKSMFALQLAAYKACGLDMTGFCQGVEYPLGRVTFLAAEDPPEAIEHRLYAIGQHIQSSLNSENDSELAMELIAERVEIESLLGHQIDIQRQDWVTFIESMAKDRHIIFLDTLRRFHAAEENDSGAMAFILGILEGIAQRTGCAIIFLHHASKSAALGGQGDQQQASRGSSVLVDNIRWQAFIAGMSEKEAKDKQVDAEMRRFHVRSGVSKQNYGVPVADLWLKRSEGGVLIPGEFPTSYITAKPSKEVWK